MRISGWSPPSRDSRTWIRRRADRGPQVEPWQYGRGAQLKARSKSVAVTVGRAAGPSARIRFRRRANQIWANLIDNALDAVRIQGVSM
jgi:hypothetical protein